MPNGETFLDVLLRYGQKYRAEKMSNETSLFGDLNDTDVCIVHPAIPEGVTMSTLERLNLEKEYVGLYLSMHPLDEYKYQLCYACNTTMEELNIVPNPKRDERPGVLADLEKHPDQLAKINLIQQREIVCGGLVTGWREGTSSKGNMYGILTVEDYSGKHDFVLFGQNFPTFRGYGKEGMYVLIHAKYQPNIYLRGPVRNIFDLEFSIGKIEQLDFVADTLIQDFTVELDSLKLTDNTVKRLQEEILNIPQKDNVKAPTTSLYFDVCDAIKNYRVHLFCRGHKVRINTELVDYVCSLEGVNTCLINGRPLIKETNKEADSEEEDSSKEEMEEMLPDD
jgi:DNA polymerase-3 subunit alpha